MAQLKDLIVTGNARFLGNLYSNNASTAFGTCETAAETAEKVVTISDSGWSLQVGCIIGVKFTNSNTTSPITLNVNNSGAIAIAAGTSRPYTGTGTRYTGTANKTVYYIYDGTHWHWISDSSDSNDNTVPSPYCTTAAATAAKTASCSNFALRANSYMQVLIRYANTAASALTLNINSTGAKPIYINGAASSASNYTLPAGTYFVYYNGTNYYFRTDNYLTVNITGSSASCTGNAATATTASACSGNAATATKATQDGSGNTITSYYATLSTAQTISGAKTFSGVTKVTNTTASSSTTTGALVVSGGIGCAGKIYGSSVYGAVYNDYAERRLCKEEIHAGRVVIEDSDNPDYVKKCNKDCAPTAKIISDTYGFCMGEEANEENGDYALPIGLTGRVLTYLSPLSKNIKVGDVVCSSSDGKIRKMSWLEKILHPECIIGVVSSIPTYKTWGENNTVVDGRIWIEIK